MTRPSNKLPQAIQHRACLFPLQDPCIFLLFASFLSCTPYALLYLGYDEPVLIQITSFFHCPENLKLSLFVVVPLSPSDLPSYALPLPYIAFDLLIQLSTNLPKNYANFCWSNPGTLKSNFESRKLVNKIKLDLVLVPQFLLTKNLKLKCLREKITAQNSKLVQTLASNQCKFHFIKFPAPRVDACTPRIKPNMEGMEESITVLDALHLITPFLNKIPYQITPPLCLKRTLRQKAKTVNKCLTETLFTVSRDNNYIRSANTEAKPGTLYNVFTAYKRVDKKIHPVSMQLPPDCEVIRKVPEDPLLTLPPLTTRPPDFSPTAKITRERMKELNINATGFLWPEEEKLFQHVMKLNEQGIAFEDLERGTLKESYFSPYIIPTVPHIPWEYKNIPIPPGIMPKVLEVLKLKIAAGVYEQSQSSY